MPRSQPRKESVPPTLTPHQAIDLLNRQLERLDGIIALHYDDPRVEGWESTTLSVLDGAFGRPDGEQDDRTRKFARSCDHVSYGGMPNSEYQHYHVEGHRLRKELLLAYIEQLQILAPPSAATAADQYRFHPEIERVSGAIFRDGHYKSAAFEAYVRVIDEVKSRSGLRLDGDQLMNRAFGFENQKPVLQFNTLNSDEEKDEQRGFLFLFKGIVGLRNSKAHSNRLFNDPSRAHEYLALASLLLRVLEIAIVNPAP